MRLPNPNIISSLPAPKVLVIVSLLVILGCVFLTGKKSEPDQGTQPTDTPISESELSGEIMRTPADLPERITDEVGIEMVLIPAGEYLMGSESWDEDERPVHNVYLDAFYMDVYEVTNTRYAQCVEEGACTEPSSKSSYTQESYYGNPDYNDYPVGHVGWEQAKIFCEWRGARLPTEAEWEKAARGGLVGKLYPWGDQKPDCSRVNFYGCEEDPVKVGSYPANGYGLFDMAGNVWEYVGDWYSESYYAESPSQNPLGPQDGLFRVVRGGSGYEEARYLRVANRGWDIQLSQTVYNGFRCVRSP